MDIKTLVYACSLVFYVGHCISHIFQTSPKMLKELLVQKELLVYFIV